MKDLAAEDVTTDVQGWLRRARAHFLQMDLFESVPASDTLMRIHSTAEEFDSTAEDFLASFQVSVLMDSQSLLILPVIPGSVAPYTCLFFKQDGPFASKKMSVILSAVSNLANLAFTKKQAYLNQEPCLLHQALCKPQDRLVYVS